MSPTDPTPNPKRLLQLKKFCERHFSPFPRKKTFALDEQGGLPLGQQERRTDSPGREEEFDP
jgi:hypothetical protein